MTGQGSERPDKGKGVARPRKRQRLAPKYVLRVPCRLPTTAASSTSSVGPPPTPTVQPPTPAVDPTPTPSVQPSTTPTTDHLPPLVIITPTPPPVVITPTPVPDPTSIPSSSVIPPSDTVTPSADQDSSGDGEDLDPPLHDRPCIEPYGKGFIPSRVASQAITRSIKQQFLIPWPTWGAIPDDDRKPFWQRFQMKVQWKPEHESQIQRNFHMKASHRLSKMFRDARNAGQRPNWLGEKIWNSLLAHWNIVEFCNKCAKAQRNRASERGGTLHTGGSITIHEHAIRMATRNLEAIVLEDDQERDDVEIPDETIKADGLSKIKHLKLLSVRYVNFSGSLSHLSNELGYLVWYEYPFECLPQSFQPHKLVELSLNGRSIQRLWEGTKPLPNLKRLDLAFCESLVEMPDVAEALNLEWINLEGCVKLQKLNPSIGSLRKLVLLNLRHCKKLATYHHGTDKCLFPESIIPGSQIPSLFNNEFVNVDIEYLDKENVTVDPPPVPHDNNFIGVLCCVIFRLDHKQNPMNFRRDHMWLHYENVSIHIHPYPPFLLRSIISLLGYKGFVTVDVKKVQYRWVNEQDLINLKMTHCANLTARKRKISVIEENG
ncbi:hypothetical protein LR48_Vigan05g072600 [Vigna angularis]|uniref:Uncharacterized protein n=1 Tax=Phaseolus angularis TaxID=3914 RepID=A0A0L9UKN1_PHAAN|nr:hypothetical protein LR48_Vigan05g072600 [Vigna angularis]